MTSHIGKPQFGRKPETVLSKDHEFDTGSKITIAELTPRQIHALTLLGKVWGFVKYHHPRVTGGEVHHDYELLRVLPAVLSAKDAPAAQKVLSDWVRKLGPVEECTQCASLAESKLHLRPELEWLADKDFLGQKLSQALSSIHRNRRTPGKQFYVGLAPGVGNPQFRNEPLYAKITLPDAGYQLLALFRFWNIIEYWFPYRDLVQGNHDALLAESIPRVSLARTRDAYQLEMMALIARVKDTHANLWSSLNVRPPRGECQVPVGLRFVDRSAVVVGCADGQTGALQRGDVIEVVDGVPVSELVSRWAPYYAASNEPTRLRDMARMMLRGNCVTDASLEVRRGAKPVTVKAPRVALSSYKMLPWHDRPGPAFQKLSSDVAYLKLSSVDSASLKSSIESAAGTKGLVIDIRNYPSVFTVFDLGSHLMAAPTAFASFTVGDLTNPGAFHFGDSIVIEPAKPMYSAKVVILVDEVSQSSAEYTAMAFRASPHAVVVGSTTAGADGNVSQIALPGGLRTIISGIGVFYPDRRPTQQVGIVPDIEAKPTVEGIRAGRDEVLEQALKVILGDKVLAEELQKMVRQ